MAVSKAVPWVLGARSETGYVRSANEDRMGFTRTPFGNVYVVSDGMGGYRGGALAAELTVSTLQDRLGVRNPDQASVPDRVREAFAAANQAVFERRRADDPDTRNMGATGVVLVTAGARALVGHVGDSRAYLLRHRGRALRQLTRDHTRVQKMVEAGALTIVQAADHPEANVLDRAIGHQPSVEVDVSGWLDVRPNDMVLLCSDGLSGYANDGEILKVMRSRGSPQKLADKLVDLALSKGGEDNVTVQLVRFAPGMGAALWQRFGSVAYTVPAAMLASAVVTWNVASSHLDDARARLAELQTELQRTQAERSDLGAQVERLNAMSAEQQSRIAALSQPPSAAAPQVAVEAAPGPAQPPPTVAKAAPTARPTKTSGNKPTVRPRPTATTGTAPAQTTTATSSAAGSAEGAASAPASSAPAPSTSAADAPATAPQPPAPNSDGLP